MDICAVTLVMPLSRSHRRVLDRRGAIIVTRAGQLQLAATRVMGAGSVLTIDVQRRGDSQFERDISLRGGRSWCVLLAGYLLSTAAKGGPKARGAREAGACAAGYGPEGDAGLWAPPWAGCWGQHQRHRPARLTLLQANQCARLEGDHWALGIVGEQHAGQAPEVRHVAHQHEVSRVRGHLLGPHRGIITGRERFGELDRCTEHLAPGLRGLPSPPLSRVTDAAGRDAGGGRHLCDAADIGGTAISQRPLGILFLGLGLSVLHEIEPHAGPPTIRWLSRTGGPLRQWHLMATSLYLGRESSGRARLARRLAADPRFVVEDLEPCYRRLTAAELAAKVESAHRELVDCRACPRDCGVNRMQDELGTCNTGRHAVDASAYAIPRGLNLPIVYNTSAYDSVESLRLMEGLVDIYMPDFKFWDPATARSLARAADYPERAREAIAEMHRQVGVLKVGPDGLARRGLLVRHLVMPGQDSEAAAIFSWLATALSPDTYVNVMGQYRPEFKVTEKAERYRDINRRSQPDEMAAAFAAARPAGLWRFDERVLPSCLFYQ